MNVNLGALATIVVFFGLLILLPICAIKLVRRSERRLDWRPGGDDWPDSGEPHSSEVADYLDRVGSTLSLPAADIAEVRAELADHIGDSIESLEAEGLDRDRAVRESLARLGSPTELGRQIRVAHQSTRRLLAGVGGGVFAASGGFVLGYIAGFAIAYALVLIGLLCMGLLTLVGVRVPNLMFDHGSTFSSLMSAGVFMFAAAQATKYAVRTSAGFSRRAPQSIAIFWAAASAVGFGWWAIFGMRGPMSWPGVIAYAFVPVVAFAAAFFRIERPMPHVGRNALLSGLGGFAIVILGIGLLFGATSVSESSGSVTPSPLITSQPPEPPRGNLPPVAPAAWVPQGSIMPGGVRSADTGGDLYSAITDQQAPVSMTKALTNWHDLRFEAWHWLWPEETDAQPSVDTRFSSPAIILPAEIHATWLQAIFHLNRLRDQGPWEVILTGIGPDGQRYVIADCGSGLNTQFNGSVWDWITAPL